MNGDRMGVGAVMMCFGWGAMAAFVVRDLDPKDGPFTWRRVFALGFMFLMLAFTVAMFGRWKRRP